MGAISHIHTQRNAAHIIDQSAYTYTRMRRISRSKWTLVISTRYWEGISWDSKLGARLTAHCSAISNREVGLMRVIMRAEFRKEKMSELVN